MKKTVKSLIIASSVASVVGIGAISFAAWGYQNKPVNVTGTTGTTITAIGNIALAGDTTTTGGTYSNGTLAISKKLIPCDQTATGVLVDAAADRTKRYVIEVTGVTAQTGLNVKYYIKGGLTKTGVTDWGNNKLLYTVGDVDPNISIGVENLTNDTVGGGVWKVLQPTTAENDTATEITFSEGSGSKVTIILVSDSAAGQGADINITITAVEEQKTGS